LEMQKFCDYYISNWKLIFLKIYNKRKNIILLEKEKIEIILKKTFISKI